MVGHCESVDKPPAFVKGRASLDHLSDFSTLKKVSVPRS